MVCAQAACAASNSGCCVVAEVSLVLSRVMFLRFGEPRVNSAESPSKGWPTQGEGQWSGTSIQGDQTWMVKGGKNRKSGKERRTKGGCRSLLTGIAASACSSTPAAL